jgi:hypothetical protein
LQVGTLLWTAVVVSPWITCALLPPRRTASGRGFVQVPMPSARAQVPMPSARAQVPIGVQPSALPHVPHAPPQPSLPQTLPAQLGVQSSMRHIAQAPIGVCAQVLVDSSQTSCVQSEPSSHGAAGTFMHVPSMKRSMPLQKMPSSWQSSAGS